MTKETYVSTGKPLMFKKFEKYMAPMGWKRIDILITKINEDVEFKSKFTQTELNKINRHFLHTHNKG